MKPADGNSMSNLEDIGLAPDPVIAVYKESVDRTLIRENLKLTVQQRLERLMAHQRFAEELQRAGKRARESK